MGAWALVLAAGSGTRMGLNHNKVFHVLGGKSLLGRALEAFEQCPEIEGIVLVAGEGQQERCQQIAQQQGISKLRGVVIGGAQRRDSVWEGLQALPETCDVVAIHDGARPFVTGDTIAACIKSARQRGSGVAGVPVKDTIKRVYGEDRVFDTPDRRSLWRAQTPQTFRRAEIVAAYRRAVNQDVAVTDDAMVLEWAGGAVYMVAADDRNIKITTPEDLVLARGVVDLPVRTGTGLDVHRLVPDRPLILGGVHIPWERGLLGHSDADVLTHAVMDALLGAASLGDIGQHFPDTDPAYAGASSLVLLEQVAELLERQGLYIHHVDTTLIAQAPKLAPHIPAMRANMAAALAVPVERVHVKATTTEGLGFCGEGLGIAAQAVATLG